VFEMIKNINVIFGKSVKVEKRKKNEKAPKDSLFKRVNFLQIVTLLERDRDWSCHRYHAC
jgi:hypothetical protein